VANYHCSVKVKSRSKGDNAVRAAAYRAAARLVCDETGEEFDYTRKRGVAHSEILLPASAPSWAADREALWNGVHAVEARKNSQLCREIECSLPHELSEAQRLDLARRFCRSFTDEGMVADLNVHTPGRHSDERNHHIHVLLTLREFDESGAWSKNKNRDWNSKDWLVEARERWADMCNEALAAAGFNATVSAASLVQQKTDAFLAGDTALAALFDRDPEPHLGPAAHAMEQKAKLAALEEGTAYVPVTRLGELREEVRGERSFLQALYDKVSAAKSAVGDLLQAVPGKIISIFKKEEPAPPRGKDPDPSPSF